MTQATRDNTGGISEALRRDLALVLPTGAEPTQGRVVVARGRAGAQARGDHVRALDTGPAREESIDRLRGVGAPRPARRDHDVGAEDGARLAGKRDAHVLDDGADGDDGADADGDADIEEEEAAPDGARLAPHQAQDEAHAIRCARRAGAP